MGGGLPTLLPFFALPSKTRLRPCELRSLSSQKLQAQGPHGATPLQQIATDSLLIIAQGQGTEFTRTTLPAINVSSLGIKSLPPSLASPSGSTLSCLFPPFISAIQKTKPGFFSTRPNVSASAARMTVGFWALAWLLRPPPPDYRCSPTMGSPLKTSGISIFPGHMV